MRNSVGDQNLFNVRFNENLHNLRMLRSVQRYGGVFDKSKSRWWMKKNQLCHLRVWPVRTKIKVLPTHHVLDKQVQAWGTRRGLLSPHQILTRQSWIAMKILLRWMWTSLYLFRKARGKLWITMFLLIMTIYRGICLLLNRVLPASHFIIEGSKNTDQ